MYISKPSLTTATTKGQDQTIQVAEMKIYFGYEGLRDTTESQNP